MEQPTTGDEWALRRLQLSRLIRSVGQGALVVSFSLYLRELGWSAQAIGLRLTAAGLLAGALSVVLGGISDRFGRRRFLLGYEVLLLGAALVLVGTDHVAWLTAMSLVGGFGSTQNGSPGPVQPAEQAWIARLSPRTAWGRAYSLNSALGFFGMAAGSVLAGLVDALRGRLPGPLAYRPLFLLVALGAAANLWLLYRLPEPGGGPKGGAPAGSDPGGKATRPDSPGSAAAPRRPEDEPTRLARREETMAMIKMLLVNSLNGLAVGMTSPLMSYWFATRYGVGPEALGPVFALTFVVTGLASLFTGKLSERVGVVRSVVSLRLTAVWLMLITPFVPYFWLAAALHVARSALSRGSVGLRQALVASIVRDDRRGLASSLNNLSMSLPNSAGPAIAAAMLDRGHLALPFVVAGILQFAFGILYGRLFQRYDPVQQAQGKGPGPGAGPVAPGTPTGVAASGAK